MCRLRRRFMVHPCHCMVASRSRHRGHDRCFQPEHILGSARETNDVSPRRPKAEIQEKSNCWEGYCTHDFNMNMMKISNHIHLCSANIGKVDRSTQRKLLCVCVTLVCWYLCIYASHTIHVWYIHLFIIIYLILYNHMYNYI